MNFLLEADRNGHASFLYTEGEKIIESDKKQLYIYGITDDDQRLEDQLCKREGKGFEIRNGITGIFTVVEKPKLSGPYRIIQSTMGGNKTVFYLDYNGRYYIFTSLKLLSLIPYKCCFNDNQEIISEFIYNGFIRTKDTLVQNIYKLLPEEYMEIEHGELKIHSFERIQPNPQKITIKEMYDKESQIINSYIDLAAAQDENINLAVSGGFDSNFILHFLRKRGMSVCAFSVGAFRGINEIETADRLCKYSGNVRLWKGYVSEETRGSLEEIVEALEGTMYERGIFLQYELAKVLKACNVRYILLGEGADQVFNRNFYDWKEPAYLTNYNDNPYELGSMIVLKKSVQMLDAFGVTGLYPFISQEMQELGAQVMEENKISKVKQKQMCRKYFDDYTNSLIGKNPGSTSLSALFRDSKEELEFISLVQKTNEFYNPSFRISYKYGPGESELDYYLCLEYLRIFKKIFCRGL